MFEKNCKLLGDTIIERKGGELVETWKPGTLYEEIEVKRQKLTHKKQMVKQRKKELTAKKKAFKQRPDRKFQIDTSAELLQETESLNILTKNCRDEEKLLAKEEQQYNAEKHLHIRELKRIRNEDNSKFNDFPILRDRYVLLTLLGKGGFSEVYKAFDLKHMNKVACKIHKLDSSWPEIKKANYAKHACREYNIHKNLYHPCVVRLFDVFEIDKDSFCTVLEYCKGGDLDVYLKKNLRLTPKECKLIISQIFRGLYYLNEQRRQIIHYDLKPGNILFDGNGQVKITDFGLSKVLEEDTDNMELTSQGAGTYWYLPPECFEIGQSPVMISPKVDVWSCGIILYQMLYGRKPFGDNQSQKRILEHNIISRDAVVEFPANPKVPDDAKEFIRSCLTPNQNDRPTVSDIIKSSYLLFTDR
eukprot:TRINITY_DN8125_c0_g1_i2.p1 TRINITY_DN8125_c0_g1~~TRINITY_DN8125_c0_g1_i2.p1  ORF type:complete len:416 (-),score=84.98 TRINITY_DN8125_c0_g1_i2:92-1339(-)